MVEPFVTSSLAQDLQGQLRELAQRVETELLTVETLLELEALRVDFLGRKEGQLTLIKRALKNIQESDRPLVGQVANEVTLVIESLIAAKQTELETALLSVKLRSEALDITMPGVLHPLGIPHPITRVIDEMIRIFSSYGFSVIDDTLSLEVETEYYNFEALNFPEDHPARDMQDTFYLSHAPHVLLRSQTSNMQIRHMETHKPPIRVLAPGRVYRNEAVSARKGVTFHQVEGLLIDEKTTFSDLKGILHGFIAEFFGQERPTRFRSSFFPFTEPSAEMDVQCGLCSGAGCKTCSYSGWLEILGAGMVDPSVLEGVNIDPEHYNGFAFGMGVERLAMLKYGIEDLRLFFQNDSRFLEQFRGLL
jgi:phenylalanyl-tRNA synthetase alpha chain